jgi:hypothetical protein
MPLLAAKKQFLFLIVSMGNVKKAGEIILKFRSGFIRDSSARFEK